ncbi:MAG TPA: biosynthetic peptidoglycan transglycosylase [Actinomycetota bacterium]
MGTEAPRRRVHWGRWLLRIVAVPLAVLALAASAVLALWPLTPSVDAAPTLVNDILNTHGARHLAALPVPDRVGQAVIATENSRFSSDFGVDAVSLFRTAAGRFTGSRDTGAATIEIQLAKNLYTPGRSNLVAKVEQVELAFKLDTRYPKDEILRMYLGGVYYGHGFYGLADAARGYFGTTPERLTWGQASMLAGLVQAPSAYDPYLHLDLARERQRHVVDRLVATKVLTAAQGDAVFAETLRFQ